MNDSDTPKPNRRWYRLTPDRCFVGLLVVQVFLLLSERFQWFAFNEHKGWTVLIAVGVILVAVVVMLVWGLVCLCLRRRFQFSFRSLLVFVVAVSVPLGWFAWQMDRARRQREAVTRILELGGTVVSYDYEREGSRSEMSLLLGLFGYTRTAVACRYRVLWFFTFSRGDADRLVEEKVL